MTAAILIGIGVVYLGRNLGWFIVDTGLLWSIVFALLLIFLGINLLRSKAAGEGRIAFMGGVTVGGSPYRLKSGSYLAFMGGIDLDLATAEIPEGETVLDLTAVMGGIDVTIRRDCLSFTRLAVLEASLSGTRKTGDHHQPQN